MSQLGLIMQEEEARQRESITIRRLLRERMDRPDRRRRRTLKERLGLKGMGCCGATWGPRPTTMSVRDDDEEEEQLEVIVVGRAPQEIDPDPDPGCPGTTPADLGMGMNLAAALAAERHLRAPHEPEGSVVVGPGTAPGTPLRVSLMRLLEETDGCDGGDEVGSDTVCCVCTGRKKGAAFIPCGHTFCRVCSRELWLNRGTCPLCNRPILEILDIF